MTKLFCFLILSYFMIWLIFFRFILSRATHLKFYMAVLSIKLREFMLLSSFCKATTVYLETLKFTKYFLPIWSRKLLTSNCWVKTQCAQCYYNREHVQSLQHLFHQEMKNKCKDIYLHNIASVVASFHMTN